MTVWPSMAAAAAQLDEAALVGQLGGRDILLPANDSRVYPVRARISGRRLRLHADGC